MAKAKSGTGSKPKTGAGKKQITREDLPLSYYIGQDKKAKPKKDKNGYIIPE